MIDLHCHILPGLDDGSESSSMTVEMARLAVKTGTTDIVCTPHCRSSDRTLPRRIDEICQLTSRMNLLLRECGVELNLYPGMELLCRDGLLELLESEDVLTLAGSRYLLIEFDFDAPLSRMETAIDLVTDFRLRPVIAHPERYTAVQRDPRRLDVWFRRSCLIQVNKGSILGRFGPRAEAAADWILGNGLAHLVASDAHRPDRRTPWLAEAYEAVAERLGQADARFLFEIGPGAICRGQALPPRQPYKEDRQWESYD